LPLNDMSSCFTSPLLPRKDSTPWAGIDRLQSACLGMMLFNIEALPPIPENLFTPREMARAMGMGPRRRRSFTAARLALKKLARRLTLVEEDRPDHTIETLGPDDVRPCLAESGLYCSVSHTARFVVAVAHDHPVGVDLETISNKPVRSWHIFMGPSERGLLGLSSLGPEGTATRAWTIKEAAAKALGLHLFQAIREVEVIRVGEEDGRMRYQEKSYPVRHGEGDGHVITLITFDGLRAAGKL
jgi:phosphopantetheinyl transferase